MVKCVCNITEFTKSILYNCIKLVRLKPDQPNQWLWFWVITFMINVIENLQDDLTSCARKKFVLNCIGVYCIVIHTVCL